MSSSEKDDPDASRPAMPSPRTEFGVIPITQAIDNYFELSLYLLVLIGFATLASTGGLDIPTIVLVGAAIVYRGYLVAKRRNVIISEAWTTPLTVGYFVFFAADYLFISRSFLNATVHLALFAVIVRMFTLRRERDRVMLAILAFLMVLAAAVLTVDSIFLLFFGLFMLMAVATFILMEMRRSAHTASIQARHSADLQEHRHLAFSLVQFAPALMLMILAGATCVFFLLPRMSAGYLGSYSFGTDFSSGFSDHVALGGIGQIQQSNSVVMHVQIDGDQIGRYDLHWRGVALADFDGHGWSNPREQYILQRHGDSFTVPSYGTLIAANSTVDRPPAQMIHYRVLMEPIGTNVLFLAPWARSVRGDYRLLASDQGSAIYNIDNRRAVNRYEADSDISRPTPKQLRTADQNYPPQVSDKYLKLVPEIDPRIPQLAAKITESSKTNYDRAAALETYLKTHFGYTLQLDSTAVRDPLANFLFVRKRGHCEYFASSMAVMLRTLGIPSRVVNGFRSDEFNDITGNYVVRAKDAHSWVEAYFPGYGWQTFDPTPGGNSETPQGWARLALYLDAAASFWQEWVISYDSSHQFILGQATIGRTRNLWGRLQAWGRSHYDAMLAWARRSQKKAERAPVRWVGFGGAAVLLLLLVLNAGSIVRFLRERSLRVHPERSPDQAATMWYERMARSLEKRGVTKPAAQTPQEFVKKIREERLRIPVARFTDVYESARFGNSPDDAKRLPELYEEVATATKN